VSQNRAAVQEERVMATTFVRHTVSNYKTWRKVYDDFAPVQKRRALRLKLCTKRSTTPTTSQ